MKKFLRNILFKKEEDLYKKRIMYLEKLVDKPKTIDDFIEFSLTELGMPIIDYENVDNNGKPPHYLQGLTVEQRKYKIADLASIYNNGNFQEVIRYIINLLGNHSMQKASKDTMVNGRVGIIVMRTMMKEFKNAFNELSMNKKEGDFNKFGIMPE